MRALLAFLGSHACVFLYYRLLGRGFEFTAGLRLMQERGMNARQNTTTAESNSNTAHQLHQLLVVPHSQLHMSWGDASVLVVPRSRSRKLQDFGG